MRVDSGRMHRHAGKTNPLGAVTDEIALGGDDGVNELASGTRSGKHGPRRSGSIHGRDQIHERLVPCGLWDEPVIEVVALLLLLPCVELAVAHQLASVDLAVDVRKCVPCKLHEVRALHDSGVENGSELVSGGFGVPPMMLRRHGDVIGSEESCVDSGCAPKSPKLCCVDGVKPVHASGNKTIRKRSIPLQELVGLVREVHRLWPVIEIGAEPNPSGSLGALTQDASVPRIWVGRVVEHDLSLWDIKRPRHGSARGACESKVSEHVLAPGQALLPSS